MKTIADRLQLLYEVTRQLGTFTDLDGLVRFSTRQARELFDADGCSLLLLDAGRKEFYFPVASQSESRRETEVRLKEMRFPADRGVAGWVVANGQSVFVEDVAKDPRFFAGIDQQTQMTTRSLLCAPLHTRSGIIGVLEVVNPAPDAPGEELRFLEALAADIAFAHEKTQLYERLRGEAVSLRQISLVIGIGLTLFGLFCIGGGAINHLALALPLGELITKPVVVIGTATAAAGIVLGAVGFGWILPRAA